VRKVFLDVFAFLFQGYRNCVFFMGDGVPIFNVESFLEMHRRRGTSVLAECLDEERKSMAGRGKTLMDWMNKKVKSGRSKNPPFVLQMLNTQLFAWFLEETQSPTPFHHYISNTHQNLANNVLLPGVMEVPDGLITPTYPPTAEPFVPNPPTPFHPEYPASIASRHTNYIERKYLVAQELKAVLNKGSKMPTQNSTISHYLNKITGLSTPTSSHRTSFSLDGPTLPAPDALGSPLAADSPELDLDEDMETPPFLIRQCDWHEHRSEFFPTPRSLQSLSVDTSAAAADESTPIAPRSTSKRGLRDEDHEMFQSYLSSLFVSATQHTPTRLNEDRMEQRLVECLSALRRPKARRSLSKLLDQPVNTQAKKICLPNKHFSSLSRLVSELLDRCLEAEDWSAAVPALAAGTLFFSYPNTQQLTPSRLHRSASNPSKLRRNAIATNDTARTSSPAHATGGALSSLPSLEPAALNRSNSSASPLPALAATEEDVVMQLGTSAPQALQAFYLEGTFKAHEIFVRMQLWEAAYTLGLVKCQRDEESEEADEEVKVRITAFLGSLMNTMLDFGVAVEDVVPFVQRCTAELDLTMQEREDLETIAVSIARVMRQTMHASSSHHDFSESSF
jgi:hypothetical protein